MEQVKKEDSDNIVMTVNWFNWTSKTIIQYCQQCPLNTFKGSILRFSSRRISCEENAITSNQRRIFYHITRINVWISIKIPTRNQWGISSRISTLWKTRHRKHKSTGGQTIEYSRDDRARATRTRITTTNLATMSRSASSCTQWINHWIKWNDIHQPNQSISNYFTKRKSIYNSAIQLWFQCNTSREL